MTNLQLFSSFRVFALFSHFILTTALLWTKFDPIQVTLIDPTDNATYSSYNNSYTTLISFGLIGLFVEFIILGINRYNITLFSVIHLLLDCIACVFISWIILDGLDWREYGWILSICVLLPAIGDTIGCIQYFLQRIYVQSVRKKTFFKTLIECIRSRN